MKKSIRKPNRWDTVFLLLFAVSFLFSALTVYDTVKATGTGYYIFLNTGLLARGAWDVLFTAFLVILILALVLCGTLLMHGGAADAAFFFMANGALTFYVRPDRIIAPFTGGDVLDRYGVFFRIMDYLPVWIAATVFIYLLSVSTEKSSSFGFDIKKAAALSAALIVLSAIFNSAYELFLFAAGYALLLPLAGTCSEKEKRVLLFPAAVCFAGMIWRLYSVMALY